MQLVFVMSEVSYIVSCEAEEFSLVLIKNPKNNFLKP
jgi:hypothetical protein